MNIRSLSIVVAVCCALLPAAAQARHRHHHEPRVDPRCNTMARYQAGADCFTPSFRSYSLGLVDRARSYIGTNPTGWRHVWCGRFMAMVAPDAAARVRNPNLARAWASLPHTSPHVGAIAVLSRGRRGGHVGVVSGFDARGNPIIISGNHGRSVGEGVYRASRVIAYVEG